MFNFFQAAVEQPTGLQPAPLPVGDPISTVPAPNSASNFESNSASDLGRINRY